MWSPIHPLFTCSKRLFPLENLIEPHYLMFICLIKTEVIPLAGEFSSINFDRTTWTSDSFSLFLPSPAASCSFRFIWRKTSQMTEIALVCPWAALPVLRGEKTAPQKSMPDSKIWAYFKWLEKLQHFTRGSPYHAETAMKIRGKL